MTPGGARPEGLCLSGTAPHRHLPGRPARLRLRPERQSRAILGLVRGKHGAGASASPGEGLWQWLCGHQGERGVCPLAPERAAAGLPG